MQSKAERGKSLFSFIKFSSKKAIIDSFISVRLERLRHSNIPALSVKRNIGQPTHETHPHLLNQNESKHITNFFFICFCFISIKVGQASFENSLQFSLFAIFKIIIASHYVLILVPMTTIKCQVPLFERNLESCYLKGGCCCCLDFFSWLDRLITGSPSKIKILSNQV